MNKPIVLCHLSEASCCIFEECTIYNRCFPTEESKRLEEIDSILLLLKQVWTNYPELRLLQLLSNAALPISDLFYVDDIAIKNGLLRRLNDR